MWLSNSATGPYPATGDANVQIASISEELAKKTEDAARQQEEITHLLSQIVDLQKKAKAVRLPCRCHTGQEQGWAARGRAVLDGTRLLERMAPCHSCACCSGGGLVGSGTHPVPQSQQRLLIIICKLAAFVGKCRGHGVSVGLTNRGAVCLYCIPQGKERRKERQKGEGRTDSQKALMLRRRASGHGG